MSDIHSHTDFEGGSQGFNSLDTEILIIDGPGDTTVRSPSPAVLKLLLAEREKIVRWEAELKRQQADDRADDGPNPTCSDASR